MTISEMPDSGLYRYFWGDNTYTLPPDGSGGYLEYTGTCYKSVLGAKWPVLGIMLTTYPAKNYVSAGGRFSDHQGPLMDVTGETEHFHAGDIVLKSLITRLQILERQF